ncbi:hypothetical protein ACFC4G_46545 [Streptomyces sp. NPDC056002]|uniref:hypothetical protein n=1 Tax=Streptomyces sp. NPDC056002 TaxID=3345675 RepID=UPI0035DD04DC
MGQTILPCDLNTFWDPRITQRADKYSIEEHELFAGMGYFPDGVPAISARPGRSSPTPSPAARAQTN